MRRVGVILLLLFEAVWLNAFLPGHTRGVIKLADGGCCPPKKCCDSKDTNAPQRTSGQCAVCFFAARLTTAAAFVVELPPLAQVDEAPIPAPPAIASIQRIDVFDSRGPPIA